MPVTGEEIMSIMDSSVEWLPVLDDISPSACAEWLGVIQRHQNGLDEMKRRLAAKVDTSKVYAEDGYRSAATWISFHNAERRSVCHRRVNDTRQLAAMPATAAVAASGCLTDDQVHLLCKTHAAAPQRYDDSVDASFAAVALECSYEQLLSTVADWNRAGLDPHDEHAELNLFRTFQGWWNATLHLSPADGELVNTLIDAQVDGYLRACRDGDPSLSGLSMPALRAKALVDLLANTARHAPGDISAPDRYRVAVVITAGHNADIPPEALCDADFYRLVVGNHGETLDVGRSTRRWSPAQRRAVTHRDAHCTFPHCDRPPSHCDIHHCQPWEAGGDTAITNGTLLCRHHHNFIHKRRWRVHLDRHQHAIYTKPDGTPHEPMSQRPKGGERQKGGRRRTVEQRSFCRPDEARRHAGVAE